ncbi:hypothetical protein D3C78_790480 [compost metagenome]
MVHAGAAVGGQRVGNRGVAVLRDVQRQAHRAAAAAQGAALDQTVGVGEHHLVVGGEVEQALVEQHPGVHALGRQGHGHVVDALEDAEVGGVLEVEIGLVDAVALGIAVGQVDQAAVRRAHRGDLAFVGADQAAVRLAAELAGALQRLFAVAHAQCGGA